MICPRCKARIEYETKFCPECGLKLEKSGEKVNCPQCNAEMDSGIKFCTMCGAEILNKEQLLIKATNEKFYNFIIENQIPPYIAVFSMMYMIMFIESNLREEDEDEGNKIRELVINYIREVWDV